MKMQTNSVIEKYTFGSLLRSKSKWFIPLLGLLGLANAVWAIGLLYLINTKALGQSLPFLDAYDWLFYTVLTVVSFVTSLFFQSYMIQLTFGLGKEMVVTLLDKVRQAEYLSFLRLGEEKVRTALEDITVLEASPGIILDSFNAVVMILMGIVYLFLIDVMGATILVVLLMVILTIYIQRNKKVEQDIRSFRMLNDTYMRNVDDLLKGFREVKMKTTRSNALFFDFLVKNREEYQQIRTRAFLRDMGNRLAGNYSFYLAIGVLLFVLPLLIQLPVEVRTNFIVTVLFVMAPIALLTSFISSFLRFKVALERLNSFNQNIADSLIEMKAEKTITFPLESFESLRLEAISYHYLNPFKEEISFRLDPVNITFHKGEVIFISGGNGSGKTTFMNMITGLLSPKSGAIYFNDFLITPEAMQAYRNRLSSIFTDHHLFSENYDGHDLNSDNDEFVALLERMELRDTIRLNMDTNSISHDLSKGQQKRIALIYALLEDEDLLFFDEWAAEQDPEFRRTFYTKVLPDLKEKGKTIIAITHDDAYFECADRLLRFEYGKLTEISAPSLGTNSSQPSPLKTNSIQESF